MGKPIKIIVSMEPVAKGRPRTVVKNGMIRTYTPEKTVIAESELRARFMIHQDKAFPNHTPVRLSVTFYRLKSKWAAKTDVLPVRRPDTDNFLKLVLDSMNGILVYDDSQVTTIRAAKRWSDKGHGYITIKLEVDKE